MALKMNTREVDGIAVVGLDGRVVLGEESNALREQVKKMLADGKKKIVLDMSNVSYIDSSGLAVLIEAMQKVEKYDGKFALVALQENVKPIFEIAKLDQEG